MALLVIGAAGFLLGLLVGRWWALVAAVALGAYIAVESEVEVPSWFLALLYGGLAALAIACGIAARRMLPRT